MRKNVDRETRDKAEKLHVKKTKRNENRIMPSQLNRGRGRSCPGNGNSFREHTIKDKHNN